MDDARTNQAPASPPSPAPFAPLAENQRIEALDVVRGFALIGIFLMNIEWFNRPFAAFNDGIPRDATGLDWLANWFVNYFVAGKFWTIFSLLFGMGFAVMLVRAEKAGREFKKVYLRRILALGVFGALHYIFLWEGDILFSYAVGALGLMIVLYGRTWPILIGALLACALGFLANAMFAVMTGLLLIGLLAIYLRSPKKVFGIPLFSFLLLLIGSLISIGAVVFWLLPDGPTEPRLPMSVFGPLLFFTGWMSWKYYEPAEKRSLRMAVAIYVFAGLAMTLGPLVQHFSPDPTVAPPGSELKPAVTAAEPASAVALATPAASPVQAAASMAKAASAPAKPKTKAEKAAEAKAEKEKRLKEGAEKRVSETKLFSSGSYADIVERRAGLFPEKAAGDAGFAILLVGMFLLGSWFVRSGVMENTERHLPLFRKMALWGLPVGIGLGLSTCFIAMSHTPGNQYDGWGIAHGLRMLGNLPACLGYVGMVVLMLHSKTFGGTVKWLAAPGRMALTNYLLQSLICTLYFYGYGLGHWGMSRSVQVLFVVAVYAGQIVFSHWWLSKFRYGPMEWLWRGFTYRQVPPLRIGSGSTPSAASAA
ncbi:DUF418 domain-containing protein [Roseateles microcysteis]|uniref:DUF418 domain-containing protein n=1 Tax=Roseateles microcysteis TaxID=3119057 RepID=UPI002FE50C06